MKTIDLKNFDSEQIEVYTYLVDTVGYIEDYAFRIVNNYEYSLHDDFETFVYEAVEINGGNIPEFIEFDFVGMWLHTFAYLKETHFFIDNLDFQNIPHCYKDEPEYKRWEFDFLETIKKSRFLEIHG